MLAVEQQTGETPKALQNKPRLLPWLDWVWDAYWVLDSGRPIREGSVGKIPMTEIAAYLSVFDVGDDEAKRSFITMVRALDSVHVERVNAEIARKIEAQRQRDRERSGV